MSKKLLVVGTMAYDAIETPYQKVDRILGGAATYIALASSKFSNRCGLVSVIGDDFAPSDMDKLTSLTAICKKTGNNASFTKRITDEKEVKVIGGSEKYIACSRKAYFSTDNIEGNSDINII